jgi:hypothetical protein
MRCTLINTAVGMAIDIHTRLARGMATRNGRPFGTGDQERIAVNVLFSGLIAR